MVYEQSEKVFNCCGQLIAITKAVSEKTIKCPRCGSILKDPISLPMVVIVKRN